MADTPRAVRLAHRGDWRHAPENSLDALVAAVGLDGCDGVEFDVRLAADGTPVVIHDATLDRVQGVTGRVDAMTADALAAIGVPALSEVLAALPAAAWLDVELKGTGHGAASADALARARGPRPPRAVVSSFEAESLRTMAALLPGWRRWLNADDLSPATVAQARELGCFAVSVQLDALDAAALRRATEAGLAVAAWTVRRPAQAARLEALGVRWLCVEGPALRA